MTDDGPKDPANPDSGESIATRWAGGDFTLPRQESDGQVFLCQACTRIGRCRLGVEVESPLTDDTVVSELACDSTHEGGPGVAHGGWTAGVLDELVGHVPIHLGQLAVTGQLNVTYVKPVPIERPLKVTARVVRREGTRWYVHADMTLTSTGAVLASADAVMVERDPAHFARHEAWLKDQDTAAATSQEQR